MSVYVVKNGVMVDAFSGREVDPFGSLLEDPPKTPTTTSVKPKSLSEMSPREREMALQILGLDF